MNERGSGRETPLPTLEIGRRSILKGIGAGTLAALWPKPAIALSRGVRGGAAFAVDVVRPEDLLRLRFEFFNLELNRGFLTAINPRREALLVVDFGPQHVAEEVIPLSEAEYVALGAASQETMQIQARLAGSSRLAFVVPMDALPLAYSLERLLEGMTHYVPRVVPVALPRSSPGRGSGSAPRLRKPAPDETAIEAPWRLVLSPSARAAWLHAVSGPVTRNERTELWHTRLGSRGDDGAVHQTPDDSVRAIWVRDPELEKYFRPGLRRPRGVPRATAPPFPMAYDAMNRFDAVNNSSSWQDPDYTPVPFDTDRLMLTALGAYLDIDGNWASPFNDLVQWKNRTTLGRDHYVRIVENGYLYPFGHRALKVTETERRFLGASGAYLVKREFFVVAQRKRTYVGAGGVQAVGLPSGGRRLPFRAIEVVTRVSPPFVESHLPEVSDGAVVVPLETAGGAPIKMEFRGIDWSDGGVAFASPFLWITASKAFDPAVLAKVKEAYYKQADWRTAGVGGRPVAFARSSTPGDTTYPLVTLTLGASSDPGTAADAYKKADQLPAFPTMEEASIKLPSIEKLAGASGLTSVSGLKVSYVTEFVDKEFAGNPGEAFLQFVSKPLLAFATENAGGLASPAAKLTALTRALGPAAGTIGDIIKGKFDPETVFEDLGAQVTGRILGSIPLKSVIGTVLPAQLSSDPKKALRFTATRDAAKFEWEPVLQSFGPFTVKTGSKAAFRGEVGLSGHKKAKFSGEITQFDLAFPFLIIEFTKLAFRSASGQKTDVDVMIGDVTFVGALSFVEAFRKFLGSLGDGFGIDVTPAAVEARGGFDIPAVPLGAFSLSNLGFQGSIRVPLANQPVRVRFGFSSRENPFTLAVALFGGGGWFAIELDADGVEVLEFGLEFGAMVALDVGVAEGSVEVVAGVYIEIKDNIELWGYLKMCGHVSVLGIASVSLDVYLGLEYVLNSKPPTVTGKATVKLTVETLVFSKSVSFPVEKSFSGGKETNGQTIEAGVEFMARRAALSPAEAPTEVEWMTREQWVDEYDAAFFRPEA